VAGVAAAVVGDVARSVVGAVVSEMGVTGVAAEGETGAGAVGLAAPQVGQSVRVFVMDTNAFTTRDNLKVMVNPKIITASRNKTMREGCLSFPDYLANVKRSQRITVEAFDAYGVLQTYELKHLEAVCVQHEIDHLDGILMMDRIESLKTDWLRRQSTKEDHEDRQD
jgi:peptide deformylase